MLIHKLPGQPDSYALSIAKECFSSFAFLLNDIRKSAFGSSKIPYPADQKHTNDTG